MAIAVFFLALTAVAVSADDNDNLLAVVQIFRHGHRVPITFYPTDPYKDRDLYWNGLEAGELTNEGRRDHFKLGQFTRQRYSDWLPKIYNNKHVYVESTDVDRTHISAQSNLYGLYPALDNQKWLNKIDWQAIPVHPSNPKIIAGSPDPLECPRYYKILNDVLKSEEFKRFDAKHADVYKYLTNHTNENIINFVQAGFTCDTLISEKEHGYLPEWATSLFPEPCKTIILQLLESMTHTTQLKRFRVGTLLNEIFQFFDKKIQDPLAPKYKIYSAHDINVISLLNTFGSLHYVPFAASLYIELRQGSPDYFVNIWYKAKDNLTEIRIKDCDMDCPLTKVKELFADIVLDINTYEKECSATS